MVADVSYLEVPVMARARRAASSGSPRPRSHTGSMGTTSGVASTPGAPAGAVARADVTWGGWSRPTTCGPTGRRACRCNGCAPSSRTAGSGAAEPDVSSGASAVGDIRTEILREQYGVGEDTRDIAEMFGLGVHDVLAALRHEDRLRPLKIA